MRKTELGASRRSGRAARLDTYAVPGVGIDGAACGEDTEIPEAWCAPCTPLSAKHVDQLECFGPVDHRVAVDVGELQGCLSVLDLESGELAEPPGPQRDHGGGVSNANRAGFASRCGMGQRGLASACVRGHAHQF